MDLPTTCEGPAVAKIVRSTASLAYPLLALAVLFAVIVPCMDTSCTSACCEEIAPAQQVTDALPPCAPSQPEAVVAPVPLAESVVAPQMADVPHPSVEPDPPDHLVSRLRV